MLLDTADPAVSCRLFDERHQQAVNDTGTKPNAQCTMSLSLEP